MPGKTNNHPIFDNSVPHGPSNSHSVIHQALQPEQPTSREKLYVKNADSSKIRIAKIYYTDGTGTHDNTAAPANSHADINRSKPYSRTGFNRRYTYRPSSAKTSRGGHSESNSTMTSSSQHESQIHTVFNLLSPNNNNNNTMTHDVLIASQFNKQHVLLNNVNNNNNNNNNNNAISHHMSDETNLVQNNSNSPSLSHPATRSTTGKISEEQHKANIEIGDIQSEKQGGGGIGIPGERTADAVKNYRKLKRSNSESDLKSILRTKDTEFDPSEVNRQVNYGAAHPEGVFFSLHRGNDIVAVMNIGGKSYVDDYQTIAKELDSVINSSKVIKKKVVQALEHYYKGDIETGNILLNTLNLDIFQRAIILGASTTFLAEKARELKGGGGNNLVLSAIRSLKQHSATDVFVKKYQSLAPFAGKGKAQIFSQVNNNNNNNTMSDDFTNFAVIFDNNNNNNNNTYTDFSGK